MTIRAYDFVAGVETGPTPDITDIGGSGGGGSFNWSEGANSPVKSRLGVYDVYEFEAGLAQELYITRKVPNGYAAGSQYNLRFLFISADTSGTVLFRAQSTLVRAEVDEYDSTTNQRTATNTAVTMSAANDREPQKVTLDLSSSIGEINAVAISAGDFIGVRFYLDAASTATGKAYLILGSEEESWI